MLSGKDENKVWVHLYGGEQDGWRKQIELRTETPKKFYIWHVNDGVKLDEAKGKNRMVLQSKLATMAYELVDDVIVEGERELRYKRLESADKPVANPAV